MFNWKLLFSGGRCAIGAVGLMFVYQRFSPAPGAFGKTHFGFENGEAVKDPNAQIKFGNMGYGPMYIRKLHVEQNGKPIPIEDAFKPSSSESSFRVDSVSSHLFREHKHFRPWQKDAIVPLVTVRPTKNCPENSAKFGQDFFDDLEKRKIAIVVEVCGSDMVPFKWLTHTRQLYVTAPKK